MGQGGRIGLGGSGWIAGRDGPEKGHKGPSEAIIGAGGGIFIGSGAGSSRREAPGSRIFARQ